jgi:hypothetical protein
LVALRSFLELGRQQIADRHSAIRPPSLGYVDHLVVGWKMVGSVSALDGAPQREVTWEQNVGSVESNDKKGLLRVDRE